MAAFFDVDGTLYAVPGDPTGGGTTLLHLLHTADWRGIGSLLRCALLLPVVFAMFVLDKTDRVFSMWFMSTLSLRRVPVPVIERRIQQFCASPTFGAMVVRCVHERLQWHLEQGHLVVLLSASALPITGPIAEHFKAHVACGSQCPTTAPPDGCEPVVTRGTFRNTLLVGKVKEQVLAQLIETYSIDSTASFAYSDHPTDEAMLRCVGHPCATNPTSKMRKLAKENSWPVLEDDAAWMGRAGADESRAGEGPGLRLAVMGLLTEAVPLLFKEAASKL